MTRRWAWGALLLAGCYPAARRPLALPEPATLHQWVAEAKAQLDTAFRRVDPARVEALLDPRATIVLRGRDSVSGAPAVVRALRAAYPGVGQPVVFMHAGDADLCTDGVYEYRGTLGVTITASDRAPRYADFRYAAKWESDGQSVRLVRLALYPPESEVEPREDLCPSRSVADFPARRALLSFMPGPMAFQGGASRDGFAAHMQRARHAVHNVMAPFDPDFPRADATASGGTLAIRARVGRGWALEGYLALDDAQWTAQATDTVAGAGWISTVNLSTRPLGVLVAYEWDAWRLAAGPGMVRAHLRWRETQLPLQVGGVKVQDSDAWGATLLAAYTRPLAGPLFVEVRLQHTFGLSIAVPAIANVPAGKFDGGGTTIGVHLGISY